MGSSKKELKRKREEEDEEVEQEASIEEMDTFDPDTVSDPEEWNEDEGAPSTSNDDFQKEFKVLGQQAFVDLSKINVTSSWVEAATTFPAELVEKNLADLDSVANLPDKLAKKVHSSISKWFPVQKSVLPMLLSTVSHPPVLRPRDVTISAPTGSGKTLCYVLPALAAVGKMPLGRLTALIVAPVQTLVKQIEEELVRFNAYDAKIMALSGAEDFEKELRRMHDNPEGICQSDIIVATPGRLVDHLTDLRCTINLTTIQFLIVDEADRMGMRVRTEWLDLVERRSGGLERATNIQDIVHSRKAPQKILLSATLSKDVEELYMWNLHRPCLFRATVTTSEEVKLKNVDHVSGQLALPSSIQHILLGVEQSVHPLAIFQQLELHKEWNRVVIFTNEKVSSQRLSVLLSALAGEEYKIEHLTSDLFGKRRTKVLKRFKIGTSRVLICSDVLSRGVDIDDVDCVVNYELPHSDRLFVHRAGRTARAGKDGFLLSIGDKEQRRTFKTMLRKTGLWTNVSESEVNENELSPLMKRYESALKSLQAKVENKNGVEENAPNGKQQKVSGFDYRRHKKWVPGLKEKREAEKVARWKKHHAKDQKN